MSFPFVTEGKCTGIQRKERRVLIEYYVYVYAHMRNHTLSPTFDCRTCFQSWPRKCDGHPPLTNSSDSRISFSATTGELERERERGLHCSWGDVSTNWHVRPNLLFRGRSVDSGGSRSNCPAGRGPSQDPDRAHHLCRCLWRALA